MPHRLSPDRDRAQATPAAAPAQAAPAAAPARAARVEPRSDPNFHGRRLGRTMRPERRAVLDHDLAGFGLTLPSDPTALLDPDRLFGGPRPLWLEVGFGNGEHLLGQAAAHPAVGLIGCEPFLNGVSACLKARRVLGVENIRLWPDDARAVMDRLPPACLARAFVLYPDPWPKRRHWPRRFINPDTLDRLARLLVPGAELRLATDEQPLAEWMLWQTRSHPAFAWTARRAADWRQPPADWIATRYQAKTTAAGRPPIFLIFRRR